MVRGAISCVRGIKRKGVEEAVSKREERNGGQWEMSPKVRLCMKGLKLFESGRFQISIGMKNSPLSKKRGEGARERAC